MVYNGFIGFMHGFIFKQTILDMYFGYSWDLSLFHTKGKNNDNKTSQKIWFGFIFGHCFQATEPWDGCTSILKFKAPDRCNLSNGIILLGFKYFKNLQKGLKGTSCNPCRVFVGQFWWILVETLLISN